MTLQRIHMNRGFTLLEVIIVLTLISIFTVLAVVQHSASDATLIARTHVLTSHIRYAQMRAMNTDTRWGIHYHFNPADPADCYYLLFSGGDTTNIAQLPGESRDRVFMGDIGIAIAAAAGADASANSSFQLSFNDWGQPQTVIGGMQSSETLTLRLTKSGQAPQNIVVTRNTGYIP